MRAPNLYTIAPGVPFADALAQGVLADFAADDPLALSRVLLLLPTRRSARAVREAFLRASNGLVLLLPEMRPIGDVDEDALAFDYEDERAPEGSGGLAAPPPVSGIRRQLLLMQLVLKWGESSGQPMAPAQAAKLAATLAQFLDQAHTEQLDFAKLDALAPEVFASHWQRILEFLKIITHAWPEILRHEGALDPAHHRNLMLQALCARWRAAPPPGPVIAAGSTGSIPATAALLEVVANLPQGAVVLPGLDRYLDAESWEKLDPGHPQYGLSQLLSKFGVTRSAVLDWPGAENFSSNAARAHVLSEALRPAETTDAWRDAGKILLPKLDAALEGLHALTAPGPREEAAAIAIAMRGVLETPGQTAALVTPDRGLARRVAVELGRWGIVIDDSAGIPLAQTPPAIFIRLLAAMLSEEFAPLPLLAFCKHPLAAAGYAPATLRSAIRQLERACLRGPRPAPGIAGLRAALGGNAAALASVDRIESLCAPLLQLRAGKSGTLLQYTDAILQVAEAFAASDTQSGAARLWDHEAGETLAEFFSNLRNHAFIYAPEIEFAGIPLLLDALMEGHVVRPRYGRHNRLSIWGPLEARLQHADLLILGGLNEGVWPATANTDPWLSRPMRKEFGLPPPERRIGLSAHDFAQAANAPRVLFTRARKLDGAPAIASRWWLRLENLLGGIRPGETLPAAQWLDWALLLDAPAQLTPAPRPRPTPPVNTRPRALSVSNIELLQRDPYAIYARHVLGLKPLDPLDAELGASERGSIIHDILHAFISQHMQNLTLDDLAELRAIGVRLFDSTLTQPGQRAFWKPKFGQLAARFIEWELTYRIGGARPMGLEVTGEMLFEGPGGPFTLRARADRIDRHLNGALAILDYKTGGGPTPKQIKTGFAPQLPLEAAIARCGGFKGIASGMVSDISILRLKGADEPLKPLPIDTGLIDSAEAGLRRLIADYDNPATPYISRRAPMFQKFAGDYDHLARVAEWSVLGQDTDDEAGE